MLDLRPFHARILFRQQREMNALRRLLWQDVQACVEAHSDREKHDMGFHIAVGRCIDGAMDKYYGKRRGDTNNPLYSLITTQTRRTYAQGVRVQQNMVREALREKAPDVLAFLEEWGQRDT